MEPDLIVSALASAGVSLAGVIFKLLVDRNRELRHENDELQREAKALLKTYQERDEQERRLRQERETR